MRVRVLGRLAVLVGPGGGELDLGTPKQRAALALLLVRAGQLVTVEQLIDELWPDDPPKSALANARTYTANLRRLFRTAAVSDIRLESRGVGYVLHVEPGQLDVMVFQDLLRQGRDVGRGDLTAAAGCLDRALGLWRGQPFEDVPVGPALTARRTLLVEEHTAAAEDRAEALLGLGQERAAVSALREHVRDHPTRERGWELLMTALHRTGDVAAALQAYTDARTALVEHLGVEPGTRLHELHQLVLQGEPGPRPKPAPATRVPAQLPMDVRGFAGRAQEIAELDSVLATADEDTTAVIISAIAGTAGVGKTALAVHWAHQVRHRFPDGQLFVDLRGYSPTPPLRAIEALAGFLRALGVPAEQIPLDVEEAAGLFRGVLADKRVLLVLDNARSADQVRPLLPASPDSLVLVTSRESLVGLVASHGAHRLAVDVLTFAEAHELLSRILSRPRVEGEEVAARELARACGYLPLALRIAAANLTVQPKRAISDYLAELTSSDGLATLEVPGDAQAAVRAAFDLSYASLSTHTQRLFRLLGLNPGPDVTADTAAALSSETPLLAARLLKELASAHLLNEHAPGRFAFHDLLRRYAEKRAEQSETEHQRSAATRRLLDWYLAVTDAAANLLYPQVLRLPFPRTGPQTTRSFADNAEALMWLDAERPNLIASIKHAATHGPKPAAWLLADALRHYLWRLLQPVDWLTVARAALAAADSEGDDRARAAARISLADLNLRQSRYPAAIELYAEALTLTRRADWLDGQATSHGKLGVVAWHVGRAQDAAEHYAEALAIDRRTGRRAGQAVRLNNLGTVCWQMGRLEQAASHHAEALTINRELGIRGSEASDLCNLGETEHALGHLDRAIQYLTNALQVLPDVGDKGIEADTLCNLAAVHRDAGRFSQALEFAADAAALVSNDDADRRIRAESMNIMATIEHCLGRHQEAIDHHEQARFLANQTGTRYPETVALIGLATTHQHLRHTDRALVYSRQALALTRQAGFRVLEGQVLTVLARIEMDQDQFDRAIDLARQALAIQRDTGHRAGRALALVVLGQAQCHTVGVEAAKSEWEEALALLDDIGAHEAAYVRALIHRTYEARDLP